MSEWVVLCGEKDRALVTRVVESLDALCSLEVAGTADALRRMVLEAVPGELGVVVGPVESGVSDINLAAAVAQDGNARCVVLTRRGPSGSLRSRAARAGVDLVVDLDEARLGEEGGTDPAPRESDGGRPSRGDRPGDAPTTRGEQLDQPLRDVIAPGPGDVVRAPDPPVVPVVARMADDLSARAPVIVFCSGRGGVGKTSVVAMAAAHAASWGMRVCALDLDLTCGNLYGCFGLRGGIDPLRLLGGEGDAAGPAERLGQMASPGVQVLGPCELPETAELVMPRVGELVRSLALTSDLVLVDTSAALTDAVAQAAQLADRLALVSDGRAGSMSALARLGGLAVRLGVARTRIVRLESRADPRARVDYSLGRAEVGLEAARVYRAFEGGAEVADQLGAGQVTELVGSASPFSESVATLTAQLLSELGRLPEHEAAERAAAGSTTRRRRGLFGTRREAR